MHNIERDLGKVSLTPAGYWTKDKEFERLDVVTHAVTNFSYIAKKDVPSGIQITNIEYWQRIGSSGYKDNGIVILFDVDPSTEELVKYNLTSAIATISNEDRHPGLILGFYGYDETNKLTWFLYQFISDNVDNFDNYKYWVSLYNNLNKFKGYFKNEELLKEIIYSPTIGDYAYVGENMEEAVLYICNNNDEWTNTNTKAYQFANLYSAVHSKDFSELEYKIDEQYCDRAEKDALGNIIHFTYATKDGLQNNIFESIYKALSETTLPDGSINYEQLSESLKKYIASSGAITNMPDEEDLTVKNEVLKFKDKEYKPLDFSGKGRVYLRKNITDGINVLEQYMFPSTNTIYIIQYDYCLNGGTIKIPENCILRFDGGSFNGGTIILDNTKIEGESYDIIVDVDVVQKSKNITHIVNNTTFINITFSGTYAVGQQLFHKDLKVPIWWNGSSWITQEWMQIDVIKELVESKADVADINEKFSNVYNSLNNTNSEINNLQSDINNLNESKVNKEYGKSLSTNDFTDILKNKLDSLNNYNDTELRNKIETLITNFNTLVNDNPTQAINNFNEIIAFLENIEDSETLNGIIAGIETQIANINTSINNVDSRIDNAFSQIDSLNQDITNVNEDINQINSSFDNYATKEEINDIIKDNNSEAIILYEPELTNFIFGDNSTDVKYKTISETVYNNIYTTLSKAFVTGCKVFIKIEYSDIILELNDIAQYSQNNCMCSILIESDLLSIGAEYYNNEYLLYKKVTLIDNKVDKEEGKQLSTNDFTNSYKNKLDEIEDITDDELLNILN